MNMVISIGNSDNKLTQVEWSLFVQDVEAAIKRSQAGVHFFGGAANWMPWQNVAWILDVEGVDVGALAREITCIREQYKQYSAWVMIGEGRLI